MAAVLTSWKEIAAHLGKSIRTVQRWERELALPVRRPELRRSGIVLADPEELDRWVRTQMVANSLPQMAAEPGEEAELLAMLRALSLKADRLQEGLTALRSTLARVQAQKAQMRPRTRSTAA